MAITSLDLLEAGQNLTTTCSDGDRPSELLAFAPAADKEGGPRGPPPKYWATFIYPNTFVGCRVQNSDLV